MLVRCRCASDIAALLTLQLDAAAICLPLQHAYDAAARCRASATRHATRAPALICDGARRRWTCRACSSFARMPLYAICYSLLARRRRFSGHAAMPPLILFIILLFAENQPRVLCLFFYSALIVRVAAYAHIRVMPCSLFATDHIRADAIRERDLEDTIFVTPRPRPESRRKTPARA